MSSSQAKARLLEWAYSSDQVAARRGNSLRRLGIPIALGVVGASLAWRAAAPKRGHDRRPGTFWPMAVRWGGMLLPAVLRIVTQRIAEHSDGARSRRAGV